ncbi:transcriptional regulatory protein ZraR [bacterium BMS3Abin07]|nr:transcriptional regulatory protein ZraR [bacterium BMS3Abin07]GBE33102.1 transcriptional regulatory protein ZraR [bacterium BMS3Bbin05]HDO21800.1 sigma-54-dependent Fis family transcriptional regulator [Nitrospirota bacterium]HDZ88772.1 sigma-54-dependent Fis family transcriptional regulator [Nitrospirota bacterium]
MSEEKILVIDDEEGIRDTLQGILEDEGYTVVTAASSEEGMDIIKKTGPELIILDIWLPNMDGIEALSVIRDLVPDVPVIMISGHANVELAVKSTKLGAYDFLEKPLSLDRILITVERALEKSALLRRYRNLREGYTRKIELVGSSAGIVSVIRQIDLAARSNARVLITGESGVGKEVAARLLHARSTRSERPFIEVNCAAIPQELIESELFGHEKGSFTGAVEAKKGKFELADQGTLFLDEVGDMSLQTQAKVLRVIETQIFQRVGGNKSIQVDVRIVAATNKTLAEEIKEGRFREDLYFRLNVIPISIPPLRERKDDIYGLVDYFLDYFAVEYGKPRKSITEAAMKKLQSYEWPGNVRELKNFIERMLIMIPGDKMGSRDIDTFEADEKEFLNYSGLRDAKEAFEKHFIVKKLQENRWNISRTAEVLGIERSNLHRKIKSLGINIP